MNEISDLLAREIEVQVISLFRPSGAEAKYCQMHPLVSIEYVDVPAALHRRVIDAFMCLILLIAKGECRRVIAALAYKRFPSAVTRLLAPRLLASWDRVGAECDVLHCHFGPMGDCAALLKSLNMIKAPISVTLHGADVNAEFCKHGKRTYREMFRFVDVIFTISEYWRQFLLRVGAPKSKLSVHHMGVDCDTLQFSPKARLAEEPFRFVTVGRLVEKKGHLVVLKAFKRLLDMTIVRPIVLEIIGSGPDAVAIERFIADHNLQDHVILRGAQSHDDSLASIRDAHVFVLASQTADNGDMEGIPVSLMEAMAIGRPVISTFHSGIPELVEDGVSGFLVSEGDDVALAQAMQRLVDHPESWGALAGAGREQVSASFNRNLLSDKFVDELCSLRSRQ